ncbi:MAG: DNA-processing protein DprA [Prevotellaceae bacterium]|nr:DNA-processing protein DprA [Prevotellaceae bacterium]
MNEQVIYAIALSKSLPMDFVAQRVLLERFGSAKGVYEHRHNLLDDDDDGKAATGALAKAVAQMERYLEEAREELRWARDFGVDCLTLDDSRYPRRLRECPDAPAVLYRLGGADLNAERVVSVVGTRQCTEYGRTFCRRLMADLARLCPGTLVVSGLAYGIDVAAHLMALECGLPTVGVLAHGMEQIYPSVHRDVANRMLRDGGGLVTEYTHGSRIGKINFVSRNRIVAGMADAVIVVESKRKGGSLITARLANEYNREVMAVPGRAFDERSEGCNNLIRDNKAHLIDSAEDLISVMGWAAPENAGEPQQRELFPPLSEEEQKVVLRLREDYEGKDLNQLAIATDIPMVQLVSVLFDLVEKGIIHQISGGRYAML